MARSLSVPIEQLISSPNRGEGDRERVGASAIATADVVIVGSGYGASIVAARLSGATKCDGSALSVMILERGREYALGEFPENMGMLPRHIRIQADSGDDKPPRSVGYADGLFDFRVSNDVNLLLGNGLGGGSLINASVAEVPDSEHFRSLQLPGAWRSYHENGGFALDADEVKRLLGVGNGHQHPHTDRKFDALGKLGAAIGAKVCAANLAVSFIGGANAVGLEQPACIRCGNCVTGCNTGAKNTLAMNLLPLAQARGAEIYTGVTVISVRKAADDSNYPWRLLVRRTDISRVEQARDEGPATWEIAAAHVILAAGALGSTEILMRSRSNDLHFSEQLGARFSTNGDGIAMGFAQQARVDPVGTDGQDAPANIGPTISGILRTRLTANGRPTKQGGTPVTIEDGAIPGSLRHVFGEMLLTAAQFNRLGVSGLPAWLDAASSAAVRPDPLASSREALAHSQLLLIMGDDKAGGSLRLCGTGQGAGVAVRWKNASRNPTLTAVHASLAKQNLKTGFDGGQYVPNPGWRLLPAEAAEAMSGTLPGGSTISVHPLGGCASADDGVTGVVNDACQVFDGSGTEVHEGLYVMDGAVLPGALAVNPFLTISVIAWRASGILIRAKGWVATPLEDARVGKLLSQPPRADVPFMGTGPVALDFSELMRGQVKAVDPWVIDAVPASKGWLKPGGLSVRGKLHVTDLDTWLENPGVKTLSGSCELLSESGADGMPTGSSEITLLSTDHPNRLLRLWRAACAMRAYGKRRGSSMNFADWLASLFNGHAKGFLNVAMDHAHHRFMHYRFTWPAASAAGKPPVQITIKGRKRLAYTSENRHVFEAMTVLDARLEVTQGARNFLSEPFELRVDLGDMARNTPPQITAMPHLPAALQSLGRLGAFAARCMIQTSFWEFGANDYPTNDNLQHPDPAPLPVYARDGKCVWPTAHGIRVPLRCVRGEASTTGTDNHQSVASASKDVVALENTFALRLLHYAQPDDVQPAAEPVVLLHGLAQGSRIFTTKLDQNMATALWRAGFDIWLVNYRLSNLILPGLKQLDWNIEDIAENDVAEALEFVHTHHREKYRREPDIRVFAHCVGATALSMALLKGWLKGIRITHVSLNAIHPWIEPSVGNDLRARLGTLARDLLQKDMLDPRPSQKPGVAETLFDRVAMAVARYQEARGEGTTAGDYPPDGDAPHHRTDKSSGIERTLCDRMTLLYGRMWKHGNLDPRTHHDFLQMIGPAPVSVYNQLYYLCRRHRITDCEGENGFLVESEVRTNWTPDTLFVHGEDSEVFHPQSSTRSAIRLNILLQGLNPARQIRVKRFPGQGHMDVVFSRRAADTVYPLLVKFFSNKAAASDFDRVNENMDPEWAAPSVPLTGPFIRSARRMASGGVRVRLWAELDGYSTSEGRLRFVNTRDVRNPEQGNHRWVEAEIPAGYTVPIKLCVEYDQRGVDTIGGNLARYPVWGGNITLHLAAADALNAVTGNTGTQMEQMEDPGQPCEGGVDLPLTKLPWFKRLQEGTPQALRMLVGSCRYPAQFMDGDMSDSVFAGMLTHVHDAEGRPGADMAFFIGDQIYADATAGLVDSDNWRERYVQRYRRAFSSPLFSELGRSLPLHFAVDDHEVDDQWSGEQTIQGRTTKAMEVARLFQQTDWSLGPKRFWYALDFPNETACPVFVMDTRFEREFRDAGNLLTARMIQDEQRQAITGWLDTCEEFDGPKFIVNSVVVAPISHRLQDEHGVIDLTAGGSWNEDGWAGYPETLGWLIEELVRRQLQNVVFIGGDLHLSAVADLVLYVEGGTPLAALQIISSGLYAPLPLASTQPEELAMSATVRVTPTVSFEYNASLLSSAHRHFVRIDAERNGDDQGPPWSLNVAAFDAAGAALPGP